MCCVSLFGDSVSLGEEHFLCVEAGVDSPPGPLEKCFLLLKEQICLAIIESLPHFTFDTTAYSLNKKRDHGDIN